MSKPILVTGSHRSGTTWVGRMLCESGEAGYIHEPFNPDRRPGWTAGRIPCWFLYVTRANERFYLPLMRDVMAFRYPARLNLAELTSLRRAAMFGLDSVHALRCRRRRLRPLVKDPIALFSAEWLAERFDMHVVVMIRHPAAFVSSLKRLDWRFRFRGWLQQEALMRDRLQPFDAEIRDCWGKEAEMVEQGIVMWNAMHHVIGEYRRRHPSWTFVRHEDIARAPRVGFESLYERAGLHWDDGVATRILSYSSTGNRGELPVWRHSGVRRDSAATARSWRQHLTAREISEVRAGTEAVASGFYGDADWAPSPPTPEVSG